MLGADVEGSVRKRDDEMNLMRVLAKRLQKTEEELAALDPEARERVEGYLHSKFGWFRRDKA